MNSIEDFINNADDSTKRRAKFFELNYNAPAVVHLTQSKKLYLGQKRNKKCRFCGKSSNETSFKNESHAIPEFIGNKVLIANYECDSCNLKFSTLLEGHLANYMNLSHTLSQVKGKKGVPSFKSNKKLSRIDIRKESVEVKNFDEDSISEINVDKGTISITANTPSYVPVAVFKCFVKMALTLLPDNELPYFLDTMDWINEQPHSNTKFKFRRLQLMKSFVSGVHPFDFITVGLSKRRESATNDVPYMIFFIAYSNYVFQIHLPLCSKDSHLTDVEMTFFPTAIDYTQGSAAFDRSIIDLKSTDWVKGDKETIVMGFNSVERKDL